LEKEEEKLKIEKTILDLEERLNQYIDSFNTDFRAVKNHVIISIFERLR
jgi:hypothetical protein